MTSAGLTPLPGGARADAEAVLAQLRALRAADRDDSFELLLVDGVTALCRATGGMLLRLPRAAAIGADVQAEVRVRQGLDEADVPELLSWAQDVAGRALERGFATESRGGSNLLVVRVTGLGAPTLLLLDIPSRERGQINELVLRARLVADLATPGGGSGGGDALLNALEIVVDVMRERRFGAAALARVNGIAAHLGAAAVALGWQDVDYVRVQAISHLDRFERKTENVQLLEAAFEEALDQRADIAFPGEDASLVTVATERLQRGLGYESVHSMPLRTSGETLDVVLLVAGTPDALDPSRLERVSFALQLLLPWLDNLRRSDRPFHERWLASARDAIGGVVGLDNVGRKVVAIILAGVLLFVLLGTWPHRIEASAELRTDSTRIVSAPYDSFLEDVLVTSGDEIAAGATLGRLDVQDLYLQESEVRADIRRYEAEADRARADGLLADVEIAMARRAQSLARLERVLYLLEQSEIRAPFTGIVVEGERSELLGRPVQQGDRIFRLARVEGLYAVVRVPERDIRFVEGAGRGELRLLSQPDRTVRFSIDTLIPVAQVEGQSGNFFLLKVSLDSAPEEWWRPGMAGMARIDAGRANIAWLLTHRLLDTLRTRFWWW